MSHAETDIIERSEPAPVIRVGSGDLLGWLREKVAQAEKTLATREEMARTWRSGTNAQWDSYAAMHPLTAGRSPSKKADRLKEAETHDRIAIKLRHELTMFRATLDALRHPNAELCREGGEKKL